MKVLLSKIKNTTERIVYKLNRIIVILKYIDQPHFTSLTAIVFFHIKTIRYS